MQTPEEVLANTHIVYTSEASSNYKPHTNHRFYSHIVSLGLNGTTTLRDFLCVEPKESNINPVAEIVVQTQAQAIIINGLQLLTNRTNTIEYREVFWDILNVLRNTDTVVPYSIFNQAVLSFRHYLKECNPDWPHKPSPALEFWFRESMCTPWNFINVVNETPIRMPYELSSIIREKTFLMEGM